MKHYDLTLGVRVSSLDEAARAIQSRFGYEFHERWSSFLGGDYLAWIEDKREIKVRTNWDGDCLSEPEHADCDTIVLVDGWDDPKEWAEFINAVNGVVIRVDEYQL